MRQPGESLRCYRAFVLYRDLPPAERSLDAVARELRMDKGYVGDWSTRHSWLDRVDEWEGRVAELLQHRSLERRLSASIRHADLGEAMVAAARAAIAKGEPLPLELVPRFAEAGTKLERTAYGLGPDGDSPAPAAGPLVALSFGSQTPSWLPQQHVQPSTIGPASPVPIGSPQIERPSEEEAKDE